MLERGLLPDFSPEVLAELARIPASPSLDGDKVRDLGTFSGLLSTTMTPVTWINSPLLSL